MSEHQLKHNIKEGWKRIAGFLFPASLWSKRFFLAFLGCWGSILYFDILWCDYPNVSPMYYVATYTSSATLALLLATPSFIKGKGLVQLSVMLVVDAIFIANLLYSRTYASEIPPASYLLIGNLSEFKSAVISSLRWHDVGFPVISLCTWLIIRRLPVTSDPAALRYWIITFAVGIGATLCLSIRYGGINNHISNMRNDRILHLGPAVVYTLPSALIQHGFSTSESVSESRVRKANLFLGNRFSLSPAPDTTTPRRKNLVLIIVESLESWVIGAEIQGQEITPCLNLEAGDSTSWYAPKVFSQAGEGRSIDGQLLMTTGIYPTVNPVFSYGYPDSSYPSLAKELKKPAAPVHISSLPRKQPAGIRQRWPIPSDSTGRCTPTVGKTKLNILTMNGTKL